MRLIDVLFVRALLLSMEGLSLNVYHYQASQGAVPSGCGSRVVRL